MFMSNVFRCKNFLGLWSRYGRDPYGKKFYVYRRVRREKNDQFIGPPVEWKGPGVLPDEPKAGYWCKCDGTCGLHAEAIFTARSIGISTREDSSPSGALPAENPCEGGI